MSECSLANDQINRDRHLFIRDEDYVQNLAKQDIIEKKIFVVRGLNVMLDRDLAELYGVETRILNQAVRRNKERFPMDFMFQLTNNCVTTGDTN